MVKGNCHQLFSETSIFITLNTAGIASLFAKAAQVRGPRTSESVYTSNAGAMISLPYWGDEEEQ